MSLYLWGVGEIARTAFSYYKNVDNSHKDRKIRLLIDKEYAPTERPLWLRDMSIDIRPDIHFYDTLLNKVGLLAKTDYFFPSVSYANMGKVRRQVYENLTELIKKSGYWADVESRILTYIHPRTSVFKDTKIGPGSWIQENCNIQSGAELGKSVVVWAGGHIGHNSKIGDFSWITTGAVICSTVEIGNNCFIGANAVICPEVKLAPYTLIAAGAVVTKNTEEGDVYGFGQNNKIIGKKSWEINLK